ncbi:acyltransferase [Aeromicrobium sp.]|uniref:acyltransferase family protein n=1 Tax=Aeromicrobium sp. TaxID=1871063 RepID=UPI0019CA5A1E|nr:acyltransferase [Aeromicrobium sp.]MBC7632314.1 acyltransferase [Aeromicrobium sp.]
MPDAQPDPSTGVSSRLAWADSARALSVLAVVLFHVGLWHFLPHSAELWEPAARAWAKINGILASVRIPLLLAVSGLVMSRRIRLGFADPANIGRAIASYYLYIVWLLIYALFFALVTYDDLPHRIHGPLDLFAQFLVPDTTLWYVFALAVYVLVFSALRQLPPWIVLVALAALTIIIRISDVQGLQAYKIPEVAFFFAVGVYGASQIRSLAENSTVLRGAALLVLAAVVTLGGRFMTGEISGSVLFMVRGVTFMVTSVAVIAVLVRWRPLGRAMSAVGRQTLPIYVMHPLLLYVLIASTAQWSGFDALLAHPVVSVIYPVVITVGIALISLAIHRVALLARLSLMFGLPSGVRESLSRILAQRA